MKQPTQDQATNTATAADPNITAVELESPIKRGENSITVIEVRKPNVGSLRGLSLQNVLQWDVNTMTTLLTRITSPVLNESEIRNMDIPDFTALNVAVTDFLASANAKSQAALMM